MPERETLSSQALELGEPASGMSTAALGTDETMPEFLIQLAERKRLIAIITGCSLLVGLILCFVLPVRYTATTEIMPPKQTQSTASLLSGPMMFGSLAEAAGGGLLSNPNDIYVGLLKSRPVADAIIERFHLLDVYHSKDMTGARRELAKRTNILSEPSTMISVSVSDRDKQRAAEMANAYIAQLRALTSVLSMTEASKRRVFFQVQLKSQKETLIAAEEAFQEVQQNKGLVHLDAQAEALIRQLAVLHAQIEEKQVGLQALRSYSTDRNPDVQLAEQELATMQQEASRLEQNNSPSTFSNMGLKNVPKAGMDYIRAEREVQYQQALFDVLLKQYEAAKLDEAKEAAIIQVVEPAIPPDRKSFPKRGLIMVLSGILGLFLAILSVVFQYRVEHMKTSAEGAVACARLRRAFRIAADSEFARKTSMAPEAQ